VHVVVGGVPASGLGILRHLLQKLIEFSSCGLELLHVFLGDLLGPGMLVGLDEGGYSFTGIGGPIRLVVVRLVFKNCHRVATYMPKMLDRITAERRSCSAESMLTRRV